MLQYQQFNTVQASDALYYIRKKMKHFMEFITMKPCSVKLFQ